MYIYILVSLYTKLYIITFVNVEDRGSIEGYNDAFKEDEGNDAFGENEGDDERGGDAEDVARDQEQGHANARWKGQGRWRDNFEQAHGCKPMTIYPLDKPDALPWENEEVSITLEQCTVPTIKNWGMILLAWNSQQRVDKAWKYFWNI